MTAMLSINEISATTTQMYTMEKELALVSCIFEEEYKVSNNTLYCLVSMYKKVGDLLSDGHWRVLAKYLVNTERLDEESAFFFINLLTLAE